MRSAQTNRRPTLDQAVALHNEGALPKAARLYERALRETPRAFQPVFLLGVLRLQQGDAADAERRLRQALEINPGHADAWFHLAEILSAKGDADAAETAYAEATRQQPPHALACFKLGLLRDRQGRSVDARAAYERALAVRPDFPEALNNLGNLLRAAGMLDEGKARLRQAIALRPQFLAPYLNLARLLEVERHQPMSACEALEAAVRACPDQAEAQLTLGALLARIGQTERAIEHYERALQINPEYAEAYNNVGVLFLEQGFIDDARVCFERAIERQPALAEAHNNLGNLYSQLEQYDAARASFARAIELRAAFAEPHNGLGIVLNELGDVEAAEACFRAALERNDRFPEALANLGAALQRKGDVDAARHCYEESLRLAPSIALQIKMAMMLPPIARSVEDLAEGRLRLDRRLSELLTAGGRTREEELLKYPATGFYLAYHGENDRAILQKLAQVHSSVCPTLEYRASNLERPRAAGRPVRLGFVSRFFFNHSVGNFFNPIIDHLARLDGFEVYLFGVGHKEDNILRRTAAACREYVQLSARSLEAARRAIEEREIDILVYADIGMDPFTYLLSFSRLARTQCVLQGHSDTSGVPSIDYFVSSRMIEPPDAQEQYSERLLLLEELPMSLRAYPPLDGSSSREDLGLPAVGRLYVCPMKLHKIHPEMDALVAAILDRDAEGWVVFFAERGNESWTSALRERLARIAPASSLARALFLPFAADFEQFRAIIAAADVALDTPRHSGGTTANICISVGTPIVSIRGSTCRGRGPAVFYEMMGIAEGIVSTAQEYVDAAVGIANDKARRAALSGMIRERAPRLQRNAQVLDAYADLFRRMAHGDALPVASDEQRPQSEAACARIVDAAQAASIRRGMQLQQDGRLTDAEEVYLEVLRSDPQCADAWQLLGVIALQIQDAAAALPLIARAIELDPSQAHYFNNLGNALFAQKKLDDAEAMYRQAIALAPTYPEAVYNLGNTLQILQRYEEALVCYERAVELKPDYPDALFSAAGLFQARGDYPTAQQWYGRLLEMAPGYTAGYLHLGRRLFQAGNLHDGVASYQEYLRHCKLKRPNDTYTGTKVVALSSVKQWCAASGSRYELVRPAEQQYVEAPRFSEPPAHAVPASAGVLHELYLAEIPDAIVLGWHDVVLADGGQTALYDMATCNADDAIEVEHGGIRYASRDHLLMHELRKDSLPVDRGVLIAGRGRDSFAHWVIDFLPRLWILDQFPEYAEWPLLIDAGLYPQQIESLQALNRSGRPLVTLASDTAYEIDRVVQLSDLSGMRRQTYRPFASPSGNEVTVSRHALAYLKHAFAPAATLRRDGPRLYVSRLHQTQFRRMENEREIEDLLRRRGFEVIYPEQLSFAEQVRLFSEASVLAGAGGSNMINCIFAPRGAQILLFTQWHPKINYYFFSHLAQLNGHCLEYVLGEVTRRHTFYYQNDFVVDLAKIEKGLAALN
jgi:tetratricopeptide (TPR) repeat protein/capsular polysaccharide biosynthesis protein